ncbi:MAG: hypothetical protein J1E80_06005 [Desulfovibrionaceae bacterium]|nr:hypothetical protein [Desulfovibrionaceae bacterium]
MTRLALALALLTTLMTPGAVFAAEKSPEPPALFDSYVYGMARSEAEKIPGIAPGEGDMAEELILPGVTWVERPWTARFIFDSDALIEISLVGPYTRESFNAIRAQMTQEQNEIFGIVLDDRALDLFSLISAGGVDGFRARFSELLREKVPTRISYNYFSTKEIPSEVRQRATNITQLLGMVENTIKETEVTLIGDGNGSAPQVIVVSFTYPVLDVFRNPPDELRDTLSPAR